MRGIIVVVLVIFTSQSMAAAKSDGWLEYGAAYAESTAKDKPLLVLVGATWCAPCTRLRQEIDRLPADELRVVVRAHVDVDRDRATAAKLMTGSTVPQLIMFFRDEQRAWQRARLVGVQSRERITDLLRKARPK